MSKGLPRRATDASTATVGPPSPRPDPRKIFVQSMVDLRNNAMGEDVPFGKRSRERDGDWDFCIASFACKISTSLFGDVVAFTSFKSCTKDLVHFSLSSIPALNGRSIYNSLFTLTPTIGSALETTQKD